jgi:uncharacterized membrane protein YcaP (DUF421 family)
VLDPILGASLATDLFDLDVPVLEKVLRAFLVFAFLVIALRLAGKREIGEINVLDLVVLLLVSNVLQNAMIGDDNSVTGGVIGAVTLFAANYLFVRFVFYNRTARRVLEGSPTILAEDGKPIPQALRRQAISEEELQSAALEHGFSGLEDTSLIVLEPNGHLAVMGPRGAERWREHR